MSIMLLCIIINLLFLLYSIRKIGIQKNLMLLLDHTLTTYNHESMR